MGKGPVAVQGAGSPGSALKAEAVVNDSHSSLAILRDVITPAIGSVLAPGEVDQLRVWVNRDDDGSATEEWLEILAGRDQLVFRVWDCDETSQADELRERLADALREFVAESSFGWGQWREPGAKP